MKYMLLIYLDEAEPLSEQEREDCYRESMELGRQLSQTGNFYAAEPLHPTSTATSVRKREGKRIVTDGPFAETREQLGGYFLIEARDLDHAISIAERVPAAGFGTIEVRPIVNLDYLTQNRAQLGVAGPLTD